MQNTNFINKKFSDWFGKSKKSDIKTDVKKFSDFKKPEETGAPDNTGSTSPISEPKPIQPTPIKQGDYVVISKWDNLNQRQTDFLRSKRFFEVEGVTDSKGNPYVGGTPFVNIGYNVPLFMSRFVKIEKPKPVAGKPKILFLNFDISINLYGERDKKNFFKGYKTMFPVFLDIFSKIDPEIYVDFKNYSNIHRMYDDFYIDDMRLRDYDFVFFGLISQFTTTCKMLIRYLDKLKIPYLKYGTYKEYDSKDYEFDLIESLGLPYIPSVLTSKLTSSLLEHITKEIGYPLILKDVYLNQGLGIKVINNEEELKSGFMYNTEPKLVQKIVPNDGEYRVVLIKNKVVLVIKKDAIEKINKEEIDKRKAQVSSLPKQVTDMCEFVSKNLFCDIVGIDIIQDVNTKKYYIMEANSAPHLPMFSVVSGINLPKLISHDILKKINKGYSQTKMTLEKKKHVKL